MTAPGPSNVATGGFYRMDQVGKGSVTIFRLPSGRHALRLSGFYVKPNIDLEIRLSPLRPEDLIYIERGLTGPGNAQ